MPSHSLQQLVSFFALEPAELTLLAFDGAAILAVLPGVLETLHRLSDRDTRLSEALLDPEIKQLRTDYWSSVACGKLDAGFMAMAARLGSVYSDHGVPTDQLTIGHSRTMHAIANALLSQPPKPIGRILGRAFRERAAQRRRSSYGRALSKVTMLGLCLLLDGWGEAEARRRQHAIDQLERSFNVRIGGALEAMSGGSCQLDEAVKSMAAAAMRSAVNAEVVAGAVATASSTVTMVAVAGRGPCIPV